MPSVVLVTLYADSLNAIIPAISSDTYKLLGLVMYVLAVIVPPLACSDVGRSSSLIPTVFLPLPFLSYASLLGIVSTVLLICVVFVDGFSKIDAPGSLWNPATTSFSFCNLEELGLAFGLFMAGVCNNLTFLDFMCDSKPIHLVRRPRGPPILSSRYG
jgi:vesicular inhibitory amino acid transporter